MGILSLCKSLLGMKLNLLGTFSEVNMLKNALSDVLKLHQNFVASGLLDLIFLMRPRFASPARQGLVFHFSVVHQTG